MDNYGGARPKTSSRRTGGSRSGYFQGRDSRRRPRGRESPAKVHTFATVPGYGEAKKAAAKLAAAEAAARLAACPPRGGQQQAAGDRLMAGDQARGAVGSAASGGFTRPPSPVRRTPPPSQLEKLDPDELDAEIYPGKGQTPRLEIDFDRVRSQSPPRQRAQESARRRTRSISHEPPKNPFPSKKVYPYYFQQKYNESLQKAPRSKSSFEGAEPRGSYRRRAAPQRPLQRPEDSTGANECLEYLRVKAPRLDKVIDKFFGMVLAPQLDPQEHEVTWDHFREVAPVDLEEHYRGRVSGVQPHWRTSYRHPRRLLYIAQPAPSKLEKILETDFFLEDSDSNDE